MNYYIADTHFGHANIIRFDHRPFTDVYQMEEVMTMLWNAAVRKNDWVYIAGDFIWGKDENEWLRIVRKLNGHKVLILGNHDNVTGFSDKLKNEFEEICQFKEICDVGKDGSNRKVMISHYPQMFYKGSCNPKNFMICGHVHDTAENMLLEKWTKELRNYKGDAFGFQPCGQIYNVGANLPWMEYTPRTLDEIVKRWDKWHEEDSV